MPLRAKEGCPPSVVSGVNLGAPVKEEGNDLRKGVKAHSVMQRGSPTVVAGVDIGAPVKQ